MTGRWPLLALPVATVAVVALALLTAAAPRPFRIARIWGGPTDGGRLSLRVEVVDAVEARGETVERPVPNAAASLRVEGPSFEGARLLALDVEGMAEVALDVPRTNEPFRVFVSQAGEELARGGIALAHGRWAGAARRRGGFVEGRTTDGFDVRVAPERGALAVPFDEGIVFEVRRDGAALAGARLELAVTGGRLSERNATADAHGRARFVLSPDEHSLGVRLAIVSGPTRSELGFGLAVVPGALRARLLGGELVVEAPVPREIAYYALVTERQRLTGGRLTLAADASGTFSARVRVPELDVAPTHAVVATQRDLRSAAAVGWPLAVSGGEPPKTFDAVDALLLDGRAAGAARESVRRARVRWAVVAFCAVAVLLELALLIVHARSRDRELDAHLEREGVRGEAAARLAPARSSAWFFALAAVALGFLLLAIAAALKLG
ncbi:MAG TPA: hypothetical protein VFZ53_02010 [Polyangiaceae bacterium]